MLGENKTRCALPFVIGKQLQQIPPLVITDIEGETGETAQQ